MSHDIEELTKLNIALGEAETRGDRAWLDQHIASQLAFRRADGKTIDDRNTFLRKVAPSANRVTRVTSITIHGDRAVVECLVSVKSQPEAKTFHNLRLFVRHEGNWKLLGWANQPE